VNISYIRRSESVNLFAWHEVDNYGDRLGPALFHRLTSKPVSIEARGLNLIFDRGPRREIHCFLGTMAQLLSGPHRFVLWGFGTAPPEGPAHHGCRPVTPGLDIEFRALRGPLSRQVMAEAGYEIPASIPYGDPGLLVPRFYKRSPYQTDDFCLVPHHSHYEQWRDRFPGANVIDIRLRHYEDLQALITRITKYRVIFSSSLHVTILAECFGIPTCPIEPTLPFKFEDFYTAVGKCFRSLPEASRSLNWGRLYEETLSSWTPIRWDPSLWLEASPFPLPDSLVTELGRHYDQLASARKPEEAAAHSGSVKALLSLYDETEVQDGPNSESHPGEEGFAQYVVFEEGFERGLDRWHSSTEEQALKMTGSSILAEGCEIRGFDQAPHLASPFVEVGRFCSVLVQVEFYELAGTIEVHLQDEHFNTLASTIRTPGGGPDIWKPRFWPTHQEMMTRVVFVPIRGRTVVRSVRISGFSPQTAEAQGDLPPENSTGHN